MPIVRSLIISLAVALSALAVAATATAHIERASYWPVPKPDCSITPCAGGIVPKIRTLASSIEAEGRSSTYVVCKKNSLPLLHASISNALKSGFNIRPHDHRTLSRAASKSLWALNVALFSRCKYSEIQTAVNAAGNNARVVIMPGVYTEPTSRKQPVFDPRCKKLRIASDNGQVGAVSYTYQAKCPNDQNLIAVIGRAPGSGSEPKTPLEDRHGIPNLGTCIRCNLQMEGSGVNADDVVVEAGRAASGNHGPRGSVKEVGIRADRADGFVLRNVTVRHAYEHNIYVLESNGYRLDSFKSYWPGQYGVLTFVEDFGLIENCDTAGGGDSGLYPGAGADTGKQRLPGTTFRYSQTIRNCDSHHNISGYSGTDGNAVHVTNNNFYDNALGFSTDVFTAPGHPGFPSDSNLVENNNIYSNNFNPYSHKTDIKPAVPVAVGVGLWIAGGNDNIVRRNYFYNNHRRGAMLFAVPDATICDVAFGVSVTGCDPGKISTSYNNTFSENVMGADALGNPMPNGLDFWWDAFRGNAGNCWYKNISGSLQELNTQPKSLPSCSSGASPTTSVGKGNMKSQTELLACFGALTFIGDNPPKKYCSWTTSEKAPTSPSTFAKRCFGYDPRPLSGRLALACELLHAIFSTRSSSGHVPVRLATCERWNSASTVLRQRYLDQLRNFFGGSVDSSDDAGRHGPTLTNNTAAQVLSEACSPAYARSFSLYKLYGRAAAFWAHK